MIPGGNILNMALSIIAKTPFNYYKFINRTTNSVGQYESHYQAPLALSGSVQAVPRNLFQQYGLEFQKNYIKFFVAQNSLDVNRDTSGDMIVYCGNNYQIISITPWFSIDGWVEIMTVQVPNAPTVG